MEAATDAVIVIDHSGRIDTVNAAAERLFGYSASEFTGRNVSMLMPAGERERHDDYMVRYLETGIGHIIGRGREVEAVRSDGSRFPAGLTVGRIAGTQPPRFVGFIRDLTDLQRALAALQADRDRAQEREAEAHRSQARLLAVSRMATVGEMAAGIAHEINQPLTAISNYARACQRFARAHPPALDDLHECMGEIANETQRAAEIIRELRNLVRAQAEDRAARDLNDIVRQSRPLILADARVHHTRVAFELAEALPQVRADAVQIQQLLLNLTRNALEAVAARAEGERVVHLATRVARDRDVELCVRDNGPGASAEIESTMFDPFVSTKPLGTGLGLAISRTIARNHGGELAYQASTGGGACFTLRLPALEGFSP